LGSERSAVGDFLAEVFRNRYRKSFAALARLNDKKLAQAPSTERFPWFEPLPPGKSNIGEAAVYEYATTITLRHNCAQEAISILHAQAGQGAASVIVRHGEKELQSKVAGP